MVTHGAVAVNREMSQVFLWGGNNLAKGRMLQNRISKSLKMASLSNDTVRLLYTWTLSHLDINGNYYADPVMVNNLVFTRLGHSVKTISAALDELAKKGLIIIYQVKGDRYLKYPDFLEKQPKLLSYREGISEIPDLTDNSSIIEYKDLDLDLELELERRNHVIVFSRKNNSGVNQELKKQREESFLVFYKAYPKKTNKKEALARWIKAKLPDMEVILNAIEQQKKTEQWQKDNGKYIPYPSTWINQERWNDENREQQRNGLGGNRIPEYKNDFPVATDAEREQGKKILKEIIEKIKT